MTHAQVVRFALALAFVGAVAPTVASAQAITAPPTATVATAAPVGPTLAPVGIARSAAMPTAQPANLQGDPSRRDVAWMVVGGAALVVGSMVDGDAGTIIMVTGAVVALTGLWRYMQ